MLVYFLIFVAYLMYVCVHTSAKIKSARLQLLGSNPTDLDKNEIVSKLALLTL